MGSEPETDLASGSARGWSIGSIVVGVGLLIWFFVVWLVLGRNVVDAAGESIGSGLVILLVATLLSAIRSRRK